MLNQSIHGIYKHPLLFYTCGSIAMNCIGVLRLNPGKLLSEFINYKIDAMWV